MRIVFYCPDFYCPAEIKEIAEIIVTDPREVLSAISAISAGRLVSHADSVYCPAVIGFAASLVEEIKEIMEIFIPLGEALSALSAISAGQLLSHADSIYCPTVIGFAASLVEEMKEIKEILLPSLGEALSAISAISAGLKTCQLVGFVLLSRRNKGNKGNSSFGCCLRSAFGLKTSGSGTPESYINFLSPGIPLG